MSCHLVFISMIFTHFSPLLLMPAAFGSPQCAKVEPEQTQYGANPHDKADKT